MTNTNPPPPNTSRRDEILERAAQVIADRGIKNATVRDIGEAAGILSGSLYYHFESKEQIVLELLKPSTDANYESALAICAEHRGIEAVSLMIRNAVMSTAANPVRSIILRNEERAFTELALLAPIAEYRRNLFLLWKRVVKDAIELGELRANCDPDIVVLAMVDTTLGASRWFNARRPRDPDAVADELIALHLDGLRP